jgi:hypothetical protein
VLRLKLGRGVVAVKVFHYIFLHNRHPRFRNAASLAQLAA